MRYPTGFSLSLTLLSLAAAVRSQNCQLKVPNNPLTAQGLATPYEVTGCNQIDFANQGSFVEAAILDPATGNIQIYSPLVINAGMMPAGGQNGQGQNQNGQGQNQNGQNATTATATTSAAATASTAGFFIPPIVPTLPNNAVVGIWFGSNALTLTLTGATGGCVNGVPGSVFPQFAYCNGPAWFNAAKAAVSQGLLKVPAPGTGTGGQACPTTHDFRIVDQDQSDNLITTYLLLGNNTLAQNTPANSQANPNAEVLSNASDNALVTQFIDPALGCAPYQNPCPTCPTGQGASLATDELQAFFNPPVGGPALIPLNDDFVLVNGQQSLQKVNLYRDGTGQPQADNNNASALTYCQQISQGGLFINNNQQLFSGLTSPAPAMATNLFTFLAMRFSVSVGPAPGLGCTGLLNMANPVTLTMDGNGVVTAATINTQALQQVLGMVNGGGASSTSAAAASSTAATSSTASAAASTSSAAASVSAMASTTAGGTTSSASAAATSAAVTSAAAAASSPSTAPATSSAAAISAPATTSAVMTSAAALASSSSLSTAPATSSAAATSASATTSATPTGVLLQNTDTTSAIPTTPIPTSAAPTVAPTATSCVTGAASASASAPATDTVTSATTSATPTASLLQNTDTTSAIPTTSIPTSAAPTVTPTATQCAASTVTMAVTATVCSSQTSATPSASASATASDDNWGSYWDENGNWNSGGWGDNGWKRSTPMGRLHRKRRIASFDY